MAAAARKAAADRLRRCGKLTGGKEGAFDEHELEEAGAAGADGDAEGHFAFAGSGLGGEEIGYVGTGDEQDDEDDSSKDEQGLAVVFLGGGGARGGGGDDDGGVEKSIDLGFGSVGGELLEAGTAVVSHRLLHGLLEQGGRDAGAEAGPDAGPLPVVARDGFGVLHGGDEVIRHCAGLGAGEAFGGDAGDFVYDFAGAECLADGGGLAAETAGPVIVGDDGDGVGAGLAVVIGGEEAAGGGAEAERGEERAGDILADGTLHFIVGGKGDVGASSEGDDEEIGLGLGGFTEFEEEGIGEAGSFVGFAGVIVGDDVVDGVEGSGVGDGEGAEENGVDEAEGGGDGADGEGEGENGGKGDGGAAAELAIAEDGVGLQGVEPHGDFDVRRGFAVAEEAAEGAFGLFAGTAAFHGVFDVIFEFFGEFALEAAFAKDIREAGE